MLLIPATHGNTQISLMTVMSIFYSFVHFSLDSCCLFYCAPWLVVSLCVAFHLGNIPSVSQIFTICSELLYKANLNLRVDSNTVVPQQELHHCGSFRSFSFWTSIVGHGSVLLVSASIQGCGDSRNQTEKTELLADISRLGEYLGSPQSH